MVTGKEQYGGEDVYKRQVNTGLGQLDTGINGEKGLKAGVKAYTDGVSQLAGGAEQLTCLLYTSIRRELLPKETSMYRRY